MRDGSAPSLTALWIAWLNAWPAFSDAAIVISVSGSWFSKRDSRCFALNRTNSIGMTNPSTSAIRAGMPGWPSTRATSAPSTSPVPIWM